MEGMRGRKDRRREGGRESIPAKVGLSDGSMDQQATISPWNCFGQRSGCSRRSELFSFSKILNRDSFHSVQS